MQLKKSTAIALRLVVALTQLGAASVTTNNLSSKLGIPRQNLVRVVSRLMQGGIIRTAKGRSGGITLARPAGEMLVGELVLLMEGEPASAGDSPSDAATARVDEVVARALGAFVATLNNSTVADLAAEASSSLPRQDPVMRRAPRASS